MGDVLFTTEAPIANVAQLDTDEKVVFAQRIIVLQPLGSNLDRTFLKYLLLSDVAQNRIHEKGTGATVQGIKASLLKTVPIEFPPLPEQQRIVCLLERAFTGIATAEANAACADFRRRAERQGCSPGSSALSGDCQECARFGSGPGASADRREWQCDLSKSNVRSSAFASRGGRCRSRIEVHADEAFRAAGQG